MTMKMVGRTDETIPNVKTIKDMKTGETCFQVEDRKYIFKVNHNTALILENRGTCGCNGYSDASDCDITVRELFPDESITINFS